MRHDQDESADGERGEAEVRSEQHWSSRYCIESDSYDLPRGTSYEYGSGHRRVGFGWAGGNRFGIWLSFPEPKDKDPRAWFDLDSWIKDFPDLKSLLTLQKEQDPKASPLTRVSCKTWSRGQAVLIGDAAHSMTPHFGQGGGLALLDSLTLSDHLGAPSSTGGDDQALATALRKWEANHRSVMDTTQRYGTFYARLQDRWPLWAEAARPPLLCALVEPPGADAWHCRETGSGTPGRGRHVRPS